MRCFSGLLIISAAVMLTARFALAQDVAAVMVRGDVLKPGQWPAEDLKQRFSKEIQTIKFSPDKDKPQRTATGIPLLALIQAAAPKTEKVPKHYDRTFLVIVEARDSYRAFFSLAELLPECGHAQAWLVWEVDGKPLSGKEAPYRLVVLSDQAQDRYIYGIASINLVDGTKLATRLAAGQ